MNRIYDPEILIWSAYQIFDLEIIIESVDCIQFVWYFIFETENILEDYIKFAW